MSLSGKEDARCRWHSVWSPVEARFDPCFEPVIAAIPIIVAACVLLGHALHLVFRRRPVWLTNFAKDDAVPREFLNPDGKRWPQRYLAALLVLSTIGFVFRSVVVFYPSLRLQNVYPALSWAVAFLLVAIIRPRTTPAFLLALYFSIFVSQLITLLDKSPTLRSEDILSIFELITALAAIAVIMCMPLRDPALPNDLISPAGDTPSFQLRSPEDKLTLLQFFTVSWMWPLMGVGRKRQLHNEDVWSLPYEFQHKRLHESFRELKGSVVRRLLAANGLDLIITSLLGTVELVANFATPVLLQQLLSSMENSAAPKSAAITYAVLSMICRLIAAQADVLSLWYSRRAYERSRGEMITMLYEKTLSRKIVGANPNGLKAADTNGKLADRGSERKVTLSNYPRKWWTNLSTCFGRKPSKISETQKEPASMGKILNLMRNDVYEVAQRFWEFQGLVTKPLSLVLSIILIWRLMGWTSLIGVLTVVLAQIINVFMTRVLLGWERTRRKATDTRLQKTSQFVEAIRHLRYYAWEDAWSQRIMEARQQELNLRIVTGAWSTLIRFTNQLGSGLFPVAAFYAYTTLAGKPLRIDIAFPALQLFSLLESSLRDIPDLITVILNAYVAVGRIEDFMAEPNKDVVNASPFNATHLELKDASFAWPGAAENVLHNISLSFPTGLTLICGKVAAGKSALLQALLGELDTRHGELIRPADMTGFCAQTPWLQNMSIRDNILFSAPFEESRYKEVLQACALNPDMENFAHGDLSDIGENGIGLSGGQKARVALARAVYSKAKLLLLDDPLSALDHQTAETIVRRCLGGSLLEGRTTILVTHRVNLCLNLAAQLIEVSDGRAQLLDPGAGDMLSRELTTEDDKPAVEEKQVDTPPDKFMEDEHRAQGGVNWSIYWEYIKAGKLKLWLILICLFVLLRLVGTLNTWFLKQWGEAYNIERVDQNRSMPALVQQGSWFMGALLGRPANDLFGQDMELRGVHPAVVHVHNPFDDLPSPERNVRPWLIGYLLIALARSTTFLICIAFMLIITYAAGRQLFRNIIDHVSHATFRFYDVTPVGRLMNRLTSDINTIDGNISGQFQHVANLSIMWVTSVVIIALVTPTFLVFSLILTASFVLIFMCFLPTSQSLRRLEMVSLSPLMSNFGALLDGLTTVRAFCAQPRFQARVIVVVDAFQKMDHFYWSLQAWLMYRFDALSACSTLLLTLLALWTGVSPALTAFVLVAASQFVDSTHSLCKQYGRLQMEFVSVERVVELLHLEQESAGTIDPPAWWPTSAGDIVFDDVTLRYAPHLDPSLSNISLRIKGGSNTAIIGRTGSGKSTLALSLLATTLPESGRIVIDNIDISKVNTQALRRRVTFLAQDPVLFPGSMRANLDPLDEYSDSECLTVLDKIGTKQYDWTLETEIEAGGKNLSQGQRQLVGLARVILRRSPIVILDEATASIDVETAAMVQEVLNQEVKAWGGTVITIAHRLEAVRYAEYCIVLGKGRVLKTGSAEELLAEGNGGFGSFQQ